MKLKILLLSFLAVFLLAGSALAISVDGNWADWGITVADNNGSNLIPSAGIGYWIEDTNDNKDGYYVGPGYGGQNFDAEAIYAMIDNNYLYFAVVSGARPNNGPQYYEPGDIVIFTTNSTYAIETTGSRYVLNNSGYVIGTSSTGSSGDLYLVDGTNSVLENGLSNWSGHLENCDPVQLYSVGSPISGDVNFFFTGNDKTTQHSFMEGRIDLNLLDGLPSEVHWAFSCGNDGGSAEVPPVPEPATMLLLGSGLIGLAAFGRKKFRKN
jgi:hypothetical protein